MAECIHHVALCPDCGGLQAVRLDRLPGVTSVTLSAGPFSFTGPMEIYLGPVDEPCGKEQPDDA